MKFKTDFIHFWQMITNGDNFAFTRYADGEVMLIKGKPVDESTQAYKVDRWSAQANTKVGSDLIETLNHSEENYYYAISAKNDNLSDYNFLIHKIKQDEARITFANLWINNNYAQMKSNLMSLKRDVVLICNAIAYPNNYPFRVIDIIKFPDDCVNFWEANSEKYLSDLIERVKKFNNQLFFISCGPCSEIIIHKLYLNNPNNAYIDVGSSLDQFTYGYKTREYMYEGSYYSTLISQF